jgi:acid phosphatase type 7
MARRTLPLTLLAVAAAAAAFPTAAAADPVIAAAGDIACDPKDPGYNGGAGTSTRCRQRATSDLLVGAGLSAVLPLGDIQYNSASIGNINAVYAPTWGRVKPISRPILGNHEGGWTGYFDYFNGKGVADGPAGPRGKGYYSFDVGSWHLVALNSNCNKVACRAGSQQESWLRADLAAHPAACTLAYWHHPRYSSGHDGSHALMQPFWNALDDAHAEVVLSGHSHNYERFTPLDRNGNANPERGIRQFVVGTGGAYMTGGISSRIAHSEVAQNHDFGVLMLTLHPSSYEWRFVPAAGESFTDSGSGQCHGPPPAPAPPPPPAPAPDQTAPVLSSLSVSPRHVKTATTFRYRLSERSRVRFTIRRRSRGRVGSVTQEGVTGRNSKHFERRLGKRRLRRGVYRVSAVAVDAAGNRSARKRVGFRIVRR